MYPVVGQRGSVVWWWGSKGVRCGVMGQRGVWCDDRAAMKCGVMVGQRGSVV